MLKSYLVKIFDKLGIGKKKKVFLMFCFMKGFYGGKNFIKVCYRKKGFLWRFLLFLIFNIVRKVLDNVVR